MKSITILYKITLAFLILLNLNPLFAEGGMYPLSEINKLDLKGAGLKININDIYNPDSTSLVDALVNVGGCSASFVSPEGLIITNHHCAFGALQAASTVENDYINKGFLAKGFSQELEAKGLICKITDSYKDVSEEILNAVKGITDPVERVNKIKEKETELAKAAEKADSTIDAEVSEMFEGKTYVLFKYKVIHDVRIVYVPPRQIGEFGGEKDNWMWPRHTGDFSFLRAYVSPDGKFTRYSPSNVPYKPKKYLKVNPAGVNENDFVFILGYPGRTYRHKPSEFLEFQQKYQLPYISKLYDFQIDVMNKLSASDAETALNLSSRIKGLANVTKNYKGKLLGLRRLGLVEKKKEEEKKLQAFINGDNDLKKEYGNIFHQLDSVYSIVFKTAERDLWLSQITRASTLVRLADVLLTYSKSEEKMNERQKDSLNNVIRKSDAIVLLYQRFSLEADKEILKQMLIDASRLPAGERINAVDKIISGKDTIKAIDKFLKKAFDDNDLADRNKFYEMISTPNNELTDSDNPLIVFDHEINNQMDSLDVTGKKIEGTLNELDAKLLEAEQRFTNSMFIPDANSTLRLTYGHIKGYSPADAVYDLPITSLKGVIEKSFLDEKEYAVPDKLRTLYNQKDFGKFYSEEIKGLPVGILYNTDTTGGNSGSPVLNAYGELVGVNFDRTYEATINDYAWDENYSRSIGVDIRYVLWVTQKIGGADYLMEEMGIRF